MTTAADVLDDQLRDDYDRHGYALLPSQLDDGELIWLRGVYDEMFGSADRTEAGDYFDISGVEVTRGDAGLPQIIRPEKYRPELLDTRHYELCRSVAASLLDTPADRLNFFGHMILKPAQHGEPTPWHQDEAYLDPAWVHRGVSFWTPLDGASPESGCLWFVPGSHAGPVLEHHHIGHDRSTRGLMTDDVDPEVAVAVPMAAGRTSVHHTRVLHYAGPNRTTQPRRAFVLVFSAPDGRAVQPEPRPWLD